jgi:WD40 repeat protein
MLWQAADGQRVRTLPTSSGCSVCFSPDSRWLVTGTVKEFCFWEVASGSRGLQIQREQEPGLIGHAAFTRDGRVLAVSVSQWLVALVDTATGRELARLEHPDPQMISCLSFDPSGTHLAVATEGHVIQLWDLRRLSRELAALGLDWDHPPFPSDESKPVPAHLRLAAPTQR